MTDSPRMDSTPNARVEAAALVTEIRHGYQLPGPVACSFIRRGFNDTYLVEAPSEKYAFRLYFNRKYWIAGPDDFRFELELLRHARKRGVSVAVPIQRRDGELLGSVETVAGARYCALFAFADGGIDGPLTEAQARTLGETLAAFHVAADVFQPSRPQLSRYHMDLGYLLDQPVELLEAFLREHVRAGLAPLYPRFAELRELLPAFRTLNSIWDIGDVLAMRAAWGPDKQFGAGFAGWAQERLTRLFGL